MGKKAETFFAVAGGYSFKMFNVLHQRMHVIGFEVDPVLTFVSLSFLFISLSLLAVSNFPDIHNFFMHFKYSI